MEKIGIDVHKVSTQVCVLTEDGEYAESRIRTDRDSLSKVFAQRPRARVLLVRCYDKKACAFPAVGLRSSRSACTLELVDELREALEPWLQIHQQLCAQIEETDATVDLAVVDDKRVQRLLTVWL